jgi:replicative superfamily II helicase
MGSISSFVSQLIAEDRYLKANTSSQKSLSKTSMPKKVSRSGVREIKDEEKKARIAFLQSEVARLEREVAIQEERLKHSIQRYKEAEEQSKGTVARYLFCKEEDLTLEEVQEYFQELSRVQKEVAEQLSLGVPAAQQPQSSVQHQDKK